MFISVVPQAIKVDKSHVQECLLEMLTDMFGKDCIGKLIRGNNISVTVDDKVALVNVETMVCLFINMFPCFCIYSQFRLVFGFVSSLKKF